MFQFCENISLIYLTHTITHTRKCIVNNVPDFTENLILVAQLLFFLVTDAENAGFSFSVKRKIRAEWTQ